MKQIEKELMKQLRKIHPEAHCTYHYPTIDAGGYVVHIWGEPLSNKHPTALEAIREALKNS